MSFSMLARRSSNQLNRHKNRVWKKLFQNENARHFQVNRRPSGYSNQYFVKKHFHRPARKESRFGVLSLLCRICFTINNQPPTERSTKTGKKVLPNEEGGKEELRMKAGVEFDTVAVQFDPESLDSSTARRRMN